MRKMYLAALVLVVLLVAAGGVTWWRSSQGTDFARAVERAPAGTERLTWTDWHAVRAELGVDLDATSSAADVTAFLTDGFERDLTSTSALTLSSEALQTTFGFSPASLEWESFAQSPRGAVVMMQQPDAFDFDELAARLGDSGYDEPSSDTGVWKGGPDVLASIADSLTPELQHFALLADQGLVLSSDNSDYLAKAVAAATGDDDAGMAGVADVVSPSGSPVSAVVFTGGQVCTALAMSQSDDSEVEQGEELVRQAGDVSPLTGYAMSVQPGGDLSVVLGFETGDQARANADSRAALATGPAPGQGGDFADRFALSSATADGRTVTLALEPVPGQYVLSDLSHGPVLFATC